MARLPYVRPADSTDPHVARLYSQVRGMDREVIHLYQALANQPPALEAFLGMSAYIRDASSLRPAVREVAILATAQALDQPYELAHHIPLARRAGVTQAAIDSIVGGGAAGLAPVERAVVAYAFEVARAKEVDSATFDHLRSFFSAAELIDLVLTVAWYHLCAAVLTPLEVELEAAGPDAV